MVCHVGLDISIFVYRALERLTIFEHSFWVSVHPKRVAPSEGRREPYRAAYNVLNLDN